MKQKSFEKLTREFYGMDDYISAFIDYLREHKELSKYISFKDAKILIKKDMHFSPYLEELELLMKLGIPQKYVSSIMILRSQFLDPKDLDGKEFFDYVLEKDQMPEINLPIMASVNKKIGYFHPSLSLESIIKVISVATPDEALYIFYGLNKDSDFPDLYYSFDEFIKRHDVSPTQAYLFLEEYVRICDKIEAGDKTDIDKMFPDVFLEDYLEEVTESR
ncbi:MAG: hypothetical protein Q4D02_05715 [Clostridia bacterium]|nr:hypothetical protein [Clostridia bacterium]